MIDNSVKNYSQLLPKDLPKTQLDLRKIGLNALELAIKAVMPINFMNEAIKVSNSTLIIQNDEFDLKSVKNIRIIGGGKAVAPMAAFLEEKLSRIPNLEYKGVINIPMGYSIKNLGLTESISVNFSSHPIPNKVGMRGVEKMIELVKSSSNESLIFFLVSGGGSALLPLPKKGISLNDLQKINSLLLKSGASIHEINTVRKHLSDFKGGNLARLIFNSSKATLITLIISDVVGDNFDSIASGPSVPDSTTFQNVDNILKKYNLMDKISPSILSVVEEGLKDRNLETPKEGDKCFNKVFNYLIGSVEKAVQRVKEYLEKENFTVEYFSNKITGEAKLFGEKLYNDYFLHLNSNQQQYKRLALIGTGELTVTIKGKGIGGRNQEMLLGFLECAKKKTIEKDFLILGANLDGIEGNSNALGALIDNYILEMVQEFNIHTEKYLHDNDSNSFFRLVNADIISGPTGCNVNDIIFILYDNKEV